MAERNELIWLDKASAAIERAATVGEAKEIIDKSAAIKVFAAKQGWSKREINRIAEVEVRAVAKMGRLLKEIHPKKAGPGRGKTTGKRPVVLTDLGISHDQSRYAQTVADMPADELEPYLAECRDNGKQPTVTAVKRKVKEKKRAAKRKADGERVANVPNIESLEGAFATIVIDPPWDFADEGDVDQFGRGKPDYATMSIDEIAALPVGKRAAQDCHLYMWITNRSLPKGFRLFDAWGFRYVTCITWCKPSFGMGNYFRGSTEHLLFGVKGSMPLRRKDVGTWFAAPRPKKKHSAKPPELYGLVESCSHGPYLEMFARGGRKDWCSWPDG